MATMANVTSLGFYNRLINDPFCSKLLTILSIFLNRLDGGINQTEFPTHVSVLFPIFSFS